MLRKGLLVPFLLALWAAPAAADEPPLRYPPDRRVDVEKIRLDLEVDLEGRAVTGTATISGRTIAPDLSEIELDAVDLEVGSVTSLDARPLEFRSTGEKLVVAHPGLEKPGSPFRLTVVYRVRPKPEGGGLWFFGPTPDDPDVPLQVWTQGESEYARRWFPCVDTPEERQELEVIARVPAGFEALSNGALVLRDEGPGATVFSWKQELPVPAYLATLVVGRFSVLRDEWEGTPLLYYVPPGREADAPRSFSETKRMLSFFSERIGVRYPYEKYAQVCVEQFTHSGMENSSATTLTDRTLHDERAHLDYSSEGLVAHELAHQWWGDLLTCRDWRDIWLNEGFASWFEALWDEEKNGADEYAWNMHRKAGGALGGGRERPIVRRRYRDPDETFGGGTYPKGAWFLHMLRFEMGADRFWAGIRRYAREHANSAVETVDLQRAMERESGRSLGRFFDQWLERPGHPVLEVRAAWRGDDRLLEIGVEQTQRGEPFAFRAELALAPEAPGGEPRIVRLRVEEKVERLFVPLAARPRWIAFDPGQKVLRETTLALDRDQLVAALAEAPSLVSRIDAARALGKDGSGEAVAALRRALLEDRFYGVRRVAAEQLGELDGDEPRDALLAGLDPFDSGPAPSGRETSAQDERLRMGAREQAEVRGAIARALAGFHKDEKVAAELARRALAGDPSCFVEADLVRSLAGVRAPQAFEVLVKMLERPSHQEEIRRAAIDGLARLEDARGLEVVRAWAARGRPRQAREAALTALGRFGTRRELPEEARREIAAELAAALEERSHRIRGAAIDALREMGAERALPALEALARHEPREGLRERARHAAERIRSGAPPDAEMARLREDLKEVVEENRALRERLERLEARGEAEGKAAAAQPAPAAAPAAAPAGSGNGTGAAPGKRGL